MDSKGILSVETTQVLSPGMFSIGLTAAYAHNVLDLEADDGRTFNVKTLTSAYMQFAIGLFKIKRVPFMEIGVGMPVHILTGRASPYITDPGNDNYPWDQNPTAGGIQAPLQYEDNGNFSAQGAGDIYVNLKSRFLPSTKSDIGLGAVVSIAFPSSKIGNGQDHFMGTGGYTLWPRFVMDAFLDKDRDVLFSLNLGARIRFGTEAELEANPGWDNCTVGDTPVCQFEGEADNARVKKLVWQHDLTVGLGISWNLVDRKIDWVTELYGAVELTSFGKEDDYWKRVYPVEMLTGLKVYLATNSFLAVAGGVGLTGIGPTNAAGAPDFRALASFVFEPLIGDRDGDGLKDDVDKCPDDPEDFDDFQDDDGCPDPDNDKDGIPDISDKCPNEPAPGTKDGCPVREILDRDGDKIPDNLDKCPDDPEDFDTFEDKDGCPDNDNDQDGIPDSQDICRGSDADKQDNFARTKEDMDGFKDDDGCPDPDNDKDRICDSNSHIQDTINLWESSCKGNDKCPNEPETYNGYQDEDGCPDKGKVVVQKNKILILEKIYFETAKAVIKPVSYNILNAIAATLKANPSIKLVEIQGHADERGGAQYNLRLTDDRAHAVLRYLINKGVSRSRLQAKGYGESEPVCHESTEECWAKNRRVEFVIKKREEADEDF
jgi:outer membrane protein OmpA-like peptidoglycan-associated protein